jgi:hypothetical protein
MQNGRHDALPHSGGYRLAAHLHGHEQQPSRAGEHCQHQTCAGKTRKPPVQPRPRLRSGDKAKEGEDPGSEIVEE